jgi:carbon storage regulator
LIGDDIRIVVVEVRGSKVRLGIEAPRELNIARGEFYDAIPPAPRTSDGRRDDVPVEAFYDDGVKGGMG